jgi:type I restriction enzyme S subunit
MMGNWKEINLKNLIETNRRSIGRDYQFSDILYLDTGSITCNRIDGLQRFRISDAPSRAKRLVENQDIVYSTVRPNQLHYGFIEHPPENLVVSTGFVTITCDKSKLNPLFLYYNLIQEQTTEFLHSIAEASTSAYPSLKPSDIESLEILLPPLPEQRAIASILSSLDDKIDLLHLQNKTLEQLAETLFRQWFVEEAEESWEVGSINDLIEIQSGFAFKSADFKDDGYYRLVTIKNVQDGFLDTSRMDCLDDVPTRMPSHCSLEIGDILLSLTGNVGRCCLVDESGLLLNQRVAKLQPLKSSNWAFTYIFFRLENTRRLLEELSKGTAQANLSPIETGRMELQLPSLSVLSAFSETATPMVEKILKNKFQIRTLTQLRDTLLPKLVSGELRVQMNGDDPAL